MKQDTKNKVNAFLMGHITKRELYELVDKCDLKKVKEEVKYCEE
jgi:hypothetical protein